MSNPKLEQAINLLIDVNREQPDLGNMQEVFARIERCWSYETSYYDGLKNRLMYLELTKLDPAYYQCATTTALLHELYGGRVRQGEADGRRHYWLKLNGVDVDITRRQFESGTVITKIKEISANELITDSWMEERYSNLRNRYFELDKLDAIDK